MTKEKNCGGLIERYTTLSNGLLENGLYYPRDADKLPVATPQDAEGCSVATMLNAAVCLDGEPITFTQASADIGRTVGERPSYSAMVRWLLNRGYEVQLHETLDFNRLATEGLAYAIEHYGNYDWVRNWCSDDTLRDIRQALSVNDERLSDPNVGKERYTRSSDPITFEEINDTLSRGGVVQLAMLNLGYQRHSVLVVNRAVDDPDRYIIFWPLLKYSEESPAFIQVSRDEIERLGALNDTTLLITKPQD